MAEWLGHFLVQYPLWISLPVAIVVTLVATGAWIALNDGGDAYDRWRNRRKREKELAHDKK